MKNKPNITHIIYTTLEVEICKAGPSEIQGHDIVSKILNSKPTSFVSVSINPPASIHFFVLDAVQADSPRFSHQLPYPYPHLGTKRIWFHVVLQRDMVKGSLV